MRRFRFVFDRAICKTRIFYLRNPLHSGRSAVQQADAPNRQRLILRRNPHGIPPQDDKNACAIANKPSFRKSAPCQWIVIPSETQRSVGINRFFFSAFGLIQKQQKIKHGEKPRAPPPALAERARKIRPLRCTFVHRFDCGGSAKSASGLCTRLLPVVCAHPFRALALSPPLFPLFSQCDRADLRSVEMLSFRAKCNGAWESTAWRKAHQRVRVVPQTETERTRDGAPETIVRTTGRHSRSRAFICAANSAVFLDRSASSLVRSRRRCPTFAAEID